MRKIRFRSGGFAVEGPRSTTEFPRNRIALMEHLQQR